MSDATLGLRICDAHAHFFSRGFFGFYERELARRGVAEPERELRERLAGWEIPDDDPVALGRRWVEELDRHGVRRAVLFSSVPA